MKLIIESLERTPIIESVCSKMQIARSTLYRWMEEDDEFRDGVKYALESGRDVVSDVAESQLITHVRGGNMGALKYWLSNNNERYKKKYLLDANDDGSNQEVTPEIVKDAFAVLFKDLYEDIIYEAEHRPKDAE